MAEQQKPVLLHLSDSPFTNTGYSTISRYMCNYLSEHFDVYYLAHNYTGQALRAGDVHLKDGFTFRFNLIGSGFQPFCKDLIVPHINDLQPAVFSVLLDTFMLYPWITNYSFGPARSVFYFPSDGRNFPINCQNVLKTFNKQVAMAKFGQEQVKNDFGINADYIPHAVDHNLFRPLSDDEKRELRANFEVRSVHNTVNRGFLQGKFVVGVVARNQSRKMLDRTIVSFEKFSKEVPEAVLYFHSDPDDAAQTFDMRNLIISLGLENKVVFSRMKFFQNFELHDMHKVYNVMDVFFLSTSGEGFGIPTVEAMACGVPVVVTDYTTTKELVLDDGACGIAVPVATEVMGSWNVWRGCMDEEKAAAALKTLYDDPELRKEYGAVGRKKVLKHYTWEKIGPQWAEYMKSIMVR